MKIVAIVQARMNSTRLPGKVMREINGKPLIGYILERLACSRELDGIVVAAPACDEGSTLARYVRGRGVAFFAEQEEDDVTARFLTVIDLLKLRDGDAFARICGDSPLIDPIVVDDIAGRFRQEENAVLDSNVGYKMMPHGQGVEIANVKFYRDESKSFTKAQREHAGFPYFYDKITSLVVDTEADFSRIERIIGQMTNFHMGYGVEDCLALARLQ